MNVLKGDDKRRVTVVFHDILTRQVYRFRNGSTLALHALSAHYIHYEVERLAVHMNQHDRSDPLQRKVGFFERRFNNGFGVAPSLVLMFVLGLVVASFIFLVFEPSDQFPITLALKRSSNPESGASAASGETAAPAPGDGITGAVTESAVRVFEDNHYITTVYFNGKMFSPANLVLNRGEGVRFINTSNLTMRVGSRPELLSSVRYTRIIQPFAEGRGSKFEVFFPEPGVWSYENLSSPDPGVFGTVFVR